MRERTKAAVPTRRLLGGDGATGRGGLSAGVADRCKVPRAFWRALEHLQVQPAVVLSQAGLPETLSQSGGVVTTIQLFAIWKAVEELTADPDFGIRLVEATDAAGYQPAFLAACYAANFRCPAESSLTRKSQ